MNLEKLKLIYREYGCKRIYIKELAPNDNSKNQVYLGGNFEILNILPIEKITSEESGIWKRSRYKASLRFYWVQDDGQILPAPHTQLILYPKYPEVRLSGFLKGSMNAPSELMSKRIPGRLLFIGVTANGLVIGYVVSPESPVFIEYGKLNNLKPEGVFHVIDIYENIDSRIKLLSELRRIHQLNWIPSKRLNKDGKLLNCNAPNCGGYTLEAELGIRPNGFSEPDFLGWEVKQFHVKNFTNLESSTITLMTPEPTGGIYVEDGVEYFIRKYGYTDLKGRDNRMNFGGIHKVNSIHPRTKLKLVLIGFDEMEGKIRNTDGMIALIDDGDNMAASWDFASLILHWNRKHNQACYVPSKSTTNPERKYLFGDRVKMCETTDFTFFLIQLFNGNIYYDPGIKIENIFIKPTIKRRSQFRIKSMNIEQLYLNSKVELL